MRVFFVFLTTSLPTQSQVEKYQQIGVEAATKLKNSITSGMAFSHVAPLVLIDLNPHSGDLG